MSQNIRFYRVSNQYGSFTVNKNWRESLDDAMIASVLADCGYHDDGFLEVKTINGKVCEVLFHKKDQSKTDLILNSIQRYKNSETDINGQIKNNN